MFYIITKKNCEMCKKALNYLNSKKIIYKEIQVDNTMIPPELIRAMESIIIDEDTQSFASLKSFIRYKSPFFKEKNIEPILLPKDDIRNMIVSNPKEVLSFPIILMLGENGITNYVVGFSSVVLDRWIEEPWTKGNFFNINRAYGDFYCCHECFNKEESLDSKNIHNVQNTIENKKNDNTENYFKSQIEKWKNTNIETSINKKPSNKFFYDNSVEKRRNSFEKERERLFGVGNRPIMPENKMLKNKNHINNDFFKNSNRYQLEPKSKESNFHNNNNEIHNNNSNIQKSINQHQPIAKEPIYINEDIIYSHSRNQNIVNNNKPRIYGEKPIVNRNKIINDLQANNNFKPIQNDFQKNNNLNNLSPNLRRIGLGEEIGQPEFSVFNNKIISDKKIEKEKIKNHSSNIEDFLGEIKVILNNSHLEKGSTLDKKLVDYGTFNYAKNHNFFYVNEFEELVEKQTKKESNILNMINKKDEILPKEDNHYPFEKSIINFLKNDNYAVEDKQEKIHNIVFEQNKTYKPKLFKNNDNSNNLNNSESKLQSNDFKKNTLIENIDIDEKKYIIPIEKNKEFLKKPKIFENHGKKYEISEEEIYSANRKLLEFNEINYDIFSDYNNPSIEVTNNEMQQDLKKRQ